MITLDSISAANASIEIQTAAGQALAIDGSGFLTISNSSFAVTATQLDVDDLTFADDKVDASGSEVSLDAATLAALETITVVGTQIDIDDLAFGTDSVTAHQGGSWAFSIDNMSTWKTSAASISTVAELAATPLASRSKMVIQNLGTKNIYVGPDNLVTTGNGILIPRGSSFEYPFDATANVFAIADGGTSDVRVLEAAA